LAEPAERDHPQRRASAVAAAHSAAAVGAVPAWAPSCATMKARTRAMSSSRSNPATGMGAPTMTSISPEAGCQEPRGRSSALPRTAIGTIGKPVSSASMKPPFFKGRSGPSSEPRGPHAERVDEEVETHPELADTISGTLVEERDRDHHGREDGRVDRDQDQLQGGEKDQGGASHLAAPHLTP